MLLSPLKGYNTEKIEISVTQGMIFIIPSTTRVLTCVCHM